MKTYTTLFRQVSILTLACLALNDTWAQPASSPSRHLQSAVVAIKGSGPYFQLDIPTNIYPGSLGPDLQDVRVRNADGDLLPFSWVDIETESSQLESHSVSLFPLKNNQSETISGFRQNADGSLTPLLSLQINKQNPISAWIADLSQIKGRLLQAKFSIDEQAEGMFGFSLEMSDDLKNWQPLGNDGQLVQLRHNGALVENLDVGLHHVIARYLRLRWNNPGYAPWIKSMSVDSLQEIYTPPALEWSKSIAAKTCSTNFCDYSLPENTPVNSLRISVNEPNTLATVSVFGQLPAANPGQSYHHRYSPLYPLHVLRHQKRAAEAQSDREVWLNESLVYRISQPNGEAKSPDLLMDGASYKGLRLQTNGAMTTLGKVPPTIQIASLPRRLVFLARGNPPYRLEWGVAVKDGAATFIQTLMPQLDPKKSIKADFATVEIADYVAPVQAKVVEPTRAKDHKPWLWAALAAGLALLGAMVWSLLKNMPDGAEKGQK